MQINHEFDVQRPPAQVWEFFQDVPQVAECLPGAELGEDRGDGAYAGKVTVKLGPMTASFDGEATVRPDPDTMSAHIDGKGADRRGGSRGQVAVEYRLTAADGGTRVAVDADVKLSGAIAQFGRTGLITEMSNRLISEFVACLEAKLAAGSKEEAAEIRAKEVKGFSLFFASVASMLKRLFGRLLRRSGDS